MNFTSKQAKTIQQAIVDYNTKVANMDRSGISVIEMIDDKQGVVCVMRCRAGMPLDFGIARCSPEDRFVRPIGLALALARASGKKPREEFLHFFCGGEGKS